jgi:DNA (cytosine-5)-methyltransferase 1
MTYKPRVIPKPKNVLVNGSAAILIPKDGQAPLTEQERAYFSSPEYREFYRTARNHQTRSLNVDSNSVFFFGRLKGGAADEMVK